MQNKHYPLSNIPVDTTDNVEQADDETLLWIARLLAQEQMRARWDREDQRHAAA